jgi:hypothetical protein
MYKNGIVLFISICLAYSSAAQKLSVTFGSVPRSEVEMKEYPLDPTASAVILSDEGYARMEEGGDAFQIVMERNVRIKILNKKGYDYANIELPYGASDRIVNIKASTYNIVKDNVVETKVTKSEIIRNKSNKYSRSILIAFPNVAEGSVIEYQYRYITEFIHEFIPWDFQSEIPVKYSKFTAEYVNFFNYRSFIRGNASKISRTNESFNIRFIGYVTTGTIQKWVGVNIPAFKEEPYITSPEDFITRVDFELIGVSFPRTGYNTLTPSYNDLAKKLLDNQNFGQVLRFTDFLKKHTERVIDGATSDEDRLARIHKFVSNHMLFNGNEGIFSSSSLRKAFFKEKGSVFEINMILIAMLRQAGLHAEPVIFSTRSNGALHPYIAMLQKFNYVAAQVVIGGKVYIVDATEPLLAYNILPFDCLNGKGWLISQIDPKWVSLSNNETDISNSIINMEIDENGTLMGSVYSNFIGYVAFSKRKRVKLKSQQGYLDKIKLNNPNWTIENFALSNVEETAQPLIESYNIQIEHIGQTTSNDLIILNPNMLQYDYENPFSNEERTFPIDFGNRILEVFSINIIIPKGYEVEEFPQKIALKLPENGGSYIFNCEIRENTVIVQSKLSISKTKFNTDDYILLREFFAQIINKQNELLVLKKVSKEI